MAPAREQFARNVDVLSTLSIHLNQDCLLPCLYTSKSFAEAIIPRLYADIPLNASSITGLFRKSSPRTASPSPSWTGYQYTRTLTVRAHSAASCTGLDAYPEMPSLQDLVLEGGQIPVDIQPACAAHDCPIIRHYASQIRHVAARKCDVLPQLQNVDTVQLMLRPCGLPLAFGGSMFPPGYLDFIATARRVDVVWWDEHHNHRIDFIHHRPIKGDGSFGLWRGGRPSLQTRDCNYCDQVGCIRYTPIADRNLPKMMLALGRDTDVAEIKMWNVGSFVRSHRGAWRGEGESETAEEGWQRIEKDMRTSLREGRKEREGKTTGEGDGEAQPASLHFGTGEEWVEQIVEDGEFGDWGGEKAYWLGQRGQDETTQD